ncbi:insulin-like 5a [Hemibagrus wyckioides]|nr:insulin-like 5a [Hemibagrus wyckioides]
MVLYKQSTSYSTFHRPASSLKLSEERKKDEPVRATMRKSYQLPLVPLLLLWAVCSVVQVQAEVKAVKLCGREFIRAVVYTCGGSRWRRLLTPQNDVFSLAEQSSDEDLSESTGSDLSTRDLNPMMTNVCCQVGCRKSDLSLLC